MDAIETLAATPARRPPDRVQEHAVYVIEQQVDCWRQLHEALRRAEARLREDRARQPGALEHLNVLEANVRLLQHKCDRALEALGAAVSARRAILRTERAEPPLPLEF